jgi:general nucleoside transport system permease protein
MVGVAVMSTARIISDNGDLTSSGTFGVALRTAAPIALAGLSGLIAERSGTINIGLEGMMVMGTIFAGWWGWEYGPWMALLGGIIGGMLGGLLMSVATTTFGVNHIVAGVAINLIAPGVARFMASELFVGVQGGSVTSSPGNSGKMGSFTVPFLSGGDLFGWDDTRHPRLVRGHRLVHGRRRRRIHEGHDHGGHLGRSADHRAVLRHGLLPVAHAARSAAALQRRASVGRGVARRVGAQDALHRHGDLRWPRGMGGAVLVLFANRYQENQVAGRGFLGLATMIFGNWMPAGTAAGAGLFGYAQGITLRTNPAALVNALFLAAAIGLVVTAIYMAYRRSIAGAGTVIAFSLVAFWAYFAVESPNNQLVFVTPYVVTLIAVSVGAQRLRPPAEEGIPWFKGMQ